MILIPLLKEIHLLIREHIQVVLLIILFMDVIKCRYINVIM